MKGHSYTLDVMALERFYRKITVQWRRLATEAARLTPSTPSVPFKPWSVYATAAASARRSEQSTYPQIRRTSEQIQVSDTSELLTVLKPMDAPLGF